MEVSKVPNIFQKFENWINEKFYKFQNLKNKTSPKFAILSNLSTSPRIKSAKVIINDLKLKIYVFFFDIEIRKSNQWNLVEAPGC